MFLNSIGIAALTETNFERAANKSQTLRHSTEAVVPSQLGLLVFTVWLPMHQSKMQVSNSGVWHAETFPAALSFRA